MKNQCFNCGNEGDEFHGYFICETCKTNLGLFTEKKIGKYIAEFEHKGTSYLDYTNEHLAKLENTYIKQKLKLLDIKAKIESLS